MTIDDIQMICEELPAVTQDIKWENHLCFSVGNKIFLITGLDHVPPTASFKVADDAFEELTAREGFMPAPYLARYKWVFVNNINNMSQQEWKHFIVEAYNLIKDKLPKKKKQALGLL